MLDALFLQHKRFMFKKFFDKKQVIKLFFVIINTRCLANTVYRLIL